MRPKLVFTKSQFGFLCGGELHPASPEISSGRGATQQSLVYRMVLNPITRTQDCLGKHFFVIVKKIHDAKCREHIIPKIIQLQTELLIRPLLLYGVGLTVAMIVAFPPQ